MKQIMTKTEEQKMLQKGVFTGIMEQDENKNFFCGEYLLDYKMAQRHNLGDWIYDGRISYAIQKNVTLACIIKNCFNTEWATRPADLQEPRTYNVQASVKF